MTSADIVLPVPESPANSAVTPRPRPPPGRIRHSSRTWVRCRARSAISRSCVAVAGGSTRSRQPTAGSIAAGQPLEADGVLRPDPVREVGRGDRGAPYRGVQRGRPGRPDDLVGGEHELGGRGGGVERRAVRRPAPSGEAPSSAVPSPARHRAARASAPSTGESSCSGGRGDHSGSHDTLPASTTVGDDVPRPSASTRSTSACPTSASTGAPTSTPPVSRASRSASPASSTASGRSASRRSSSTSAARPAPSAAAQASAVPPLPARSRR